jgi:two-component system cell cycle sensor histidine kinase PleC
MAARAEAGDVIVSVNIEPDLPFAFVDEWSFKQILLNLLSNAVKFTPAGGRVKAHARIEQNGEMSLTVSDTCIGIAEEDQQLVFENFGQGRHDVSSVDKGTGLGLPIVKGLIAAHGGHIRLESSVGTGTSVTIFLPAERVRTRAKLRAVF